MKVTLHYGWKESKSWGVKESQMMAMNGMVINPVNAEAIFVQGTRSQEHTKTIEINLNPAMLVFIGRFLLRTLR